MTPVVQVRGLNKSYGIPASLPWQSPGWVHAVVDVDLTILPGETVAVVGRSGSGKTTLARLVLGLEEPTSGEVVLEGETWQGLSERVRRPRRVRYQYIPQDALGALDPQQTVHEHIAETLRVLAGVPRHEAWERAFEQLRHLGLDHREAALPRELSGGEQRRVTLARVLALEPRLVIADEPTSGLDPLRRKAVLDALVENLPDGAGCLIVTHDMTVATDVCDRAVTMLAGRIIEVVDLKRHKPQHPYSQALFDPWERPLPMAPLSLSGCPFLHNCPLVDEGDGTKCRAERPALLSFGDESGHRVACHAFTEVKADAC